MSNFAGRKIAVDASMALYQFLVAVRSEGASLTNEDGETTRFVHTFLHKLCINMICMCHAVPTHLSLSNPSP